MPVPAPARSSVHCQATVAGVLACVSQGPIDTTHTGGNMTTIPANEARDTTAAQLGDAITRLLAAYGEAQFQRGAYCAGSNARTHEQVQANAAAANRLTVAMWHAFYDYAGQVGTATTQLATLTRQLGDADADAPLDALDTFEQLRGILGELPLQLSDDSAVQL